MAIDLVNKIPIINDDVSKRQQWQMRKRLRIEAQEKHKREEADQIAEDLIDVSLFENQNSTDFIIDHERNQRITSYVLEESSAPEASEANEALLLADEEAFKQTFTSRYLSTDELEILLDHYEFSEDDKNDIKKLIEQVIDATEGSELSLLNSMLQKTKLNKAQLYLALNYVMEELRRRRAKKRFLQQLKRWSLVYENQESGYLAEFFALAKNKALVNKISDKCNLDALANLNSGGVINGGIKQTIQLVAELFDNNYASMVSLFMKLRAQQLILLATDTVNPETKAKLHELLSLEKNLIILHSTYLQHSDFKTNLHKLIKDNPEKSNSWLESKQNSILTATVSFCETNFVSDLAIDRLLRDWGLADAIKSSNNSFLYDLILFVHKLPLALFKDNAVNIQKITDGIRGVMRDKNTATSIATSKAQAVSFLNPKRKKINYV